MSKGVCLFVCKICIIISRQMFVYNITMFKSRRFVHVSYYTFISRYEYCTFLYIRVFQHLYYIIIFNLVLLFLMSNTVVKN